MFAQGLLPSQLADLFLWLYKECPPLESQLIDGDSDEDDFPRMEKIKSYILSDLRDRGTPEALEALSRISSALPSETWIKETLFKAEDRAIEMDLEPVLPSELLAILDDSRKRVVQSEEQLMEVVQQSLAEFQKELKGNLPSIRDLWDQHPEDKHLFRPVDELDFSNRLARHLQSDLVNRGVIVNRETAIRRGQYTDMHVDAVATERREKDKHRITVIIEAKGCWHKNLYSDMKDQLVDRYMKDNQCQHGLYLVGWFYCEKWDRTDPRSMEHPKEKRQMTVAEAQDFFGRHAAELSIGGPMVKAFVLDASLPAGR